MDRAKKAEPTAKPKGKLPKSKNASGNKKPGSTLVDGKNKKPKQPDITSNKPIDSNGCDDSINWERIELDYRIGVKSLRQISGECGVTEGAIRKRAKRDDWTRDLSEKIKMKADSLVRKDAVRRPVRTVVRSTEKSKESAYREPSEKVIIETNAQAIADVIFGHRKDTHRTMKLVIALTDALEQMTKPEIHDALSDLGELMYQPDDKGQDKLNEIYQYIIELPSMIKMIKTLSESLRILMDSQRKAFGIDDKFNPDKEEGAGGLGFSAGRQLSDAERAVRMVKLMKTYNLQGAINER